MYKEVPVVGKTMFRRFQPGTLFEETALAINVKRQFDKQGNVVNWECVVVGSNGYAHIGKHDVVHDIHAWHPMHWELDMERLRVTPVDDPANEDDPVEAIIDIIVDRLDSLDDRLDDLADRLTVAEPANDPVASEPVEQPVEQPVVESPVELAPVAFVEPVEKLVETPVEPIAAPPVSRRAMRK